MELTSDSQIPGSSQPLSLPSEPLPDIRDWFPSYQYESFVLDTYDEVGGCVLKESGFERDGFLVVGEINRETEGNLRESGKNGNSKDKLEELNCNKMLDSSYSGSLLSEPPHIKNWFSSYVYESPVSDTVDSFEGSVANKTECKKNGFAVEEINGRRNEKFVESKNAGSNDAEGSNEQLHVNMFVEPKSSLGDMRENEPLTKVPLLDPSCARTVQDSPQLSEVFSEPPHIGNWFSSYMYESPKLRESNGPLHNETECEDSEFVHQSSIKENETNSQKLQQCSAHDEIFKNKLNGVAGHEKPSTQDDLRGQREHCLNDEDLLRKHKPNQNLLREADLRSFKRNVKLNDSGRRFPSRLHTQHDLTDNSKADAETEVEYDATLGDNPEFTQVTGTLTRKSTRREDEKENAEKKVESNGFVTTRKSRCIQSYDENTFNGKPEILSQFSNNKTSTDGEKGPSAKRKVLFERANFEQTSAIEVTGKWQCPQKSKPSMRPPLKQLRLEQWIHRL